MMSRYKPVGWRGESHKHYLAAKGIRSKYFSPFVNVTTIPAIDYPEEFNSIREKSIVKMSPDEFLRLAKKTGENNELRQGLRGIQGMSQEEYERAVRVESKVARVKEGLQQGKNIPAGHIEYEAEGGADLHEGRHRAMAARDLGMAEIPVVLVRARKLNRTSMMGGSWEYGSDELEQEGHVNRKILPFKKRVGE